ncbi:MAG: ribosome maturation factor RimP [Succinivibrio sp.]|nr:ribosome maturation factor RimP [Succinivibrio sp.]
MGGTVEEKVQELVEPLIVSMGLQLWGIRFRSGHDHASLQIYVDAKDGVSADQCGDVVDMLSPALDAADLIAPAYTLEVSSPGLDRILFNLDQCRQYLGQEVKAELRIPCDGRRKLDGMLQNVTDDGMITIKEGEGQEFTVAFANVSVARLVPVFPKKGTKSPRSAS